MSLKDVELIGSSSHRVDGKLEDDAASEVEEGEEEEEEEEEDDNGTGEDVYRGRGGLSSGILARFLTPYYPRLDRQSSLISIIFFLLGFSTAFCLLFYLRRVEMGQMMRQRTWGEQIKHFFVTMLHWRW